MKDTQTHDERISEDSPPGFNDELFARRCRELEAHSQDAQAELLGLTQPNISRIRRGRQIPRVDTAVRLAKALGITVEDLWPAAA